MRTGLAHEGPDASDTLRALIGGNVRFYRELRGWTLDELGHVMGYPKATARQHAWRWEQGNSLSIETIENLAFALGVSASTLLEDHG